MRERGENLVVVAFPVIPALGRWKQENQKCCYFPDYLMSSGQDLIVGANETQDPALMSSNLSGERSIRKSLKACRFLPSA